MPPEIKPELAPEASNAGILASVIYFCNKHSFIRVSEVIAVALM